MIAVDANFVRKIVGSAVLLLVYGLWLWRTFKSCPGDRFIQSASVTVMVMVAAAAANRIHSFPDLVWEPLTLLLYLLAFLSIFFMFQQGYRALRRRKTRRESAK
jgi:hypothetical protein